MANLVNYKGPSVKGPTPRAPSFVQTAIAPFAQAVAQRGKFDLEQQALDKRTLANAMVQMRMLGAPGTDPTATQFPFAGMSFPVQDPGLDYSNLNTYYSMLQKQKKLRSLKEWTDDDFREAAIARTWAFVNNSPAGLDIIQGENASENIAKLMADVEAGIRRYANTEAAQQDTGVEDLVTRYGLEE
jgi:hypothetical protein